MVEENRFTSVSLLYDIHYCIHALPWHFIDRSWIRLYPICSLSEVLSNQVKILILIFKKSDEWIYTVLLT